MTNKETIIIAGVCSIEERWKLERTAANISAMQTILGAQEDGDNPYQLRFFMRGGAWKPRTRYRNGGQEKVFEGRGAEGLRDLHEVGREYGLAVGSEIMSELDVRHFLEQEIDLWWIGARNSQEFALLKQVGLQSRNVPAALVKNSMAGIYPDEAVGSLERLVLPNRNEPELRPELVMYCVRGQREPNAPPGVPQELVEAYVAEWRAQDPNQHPQYRNMNLVGWIPTLRENPFFQEHGIRIVYDPSHQIGGKTEETRRDIGRWAIDSVVEFGADGIMIDVNDYANGAKCDGPQASLSTLGGDVRWDLTQYEKEPTITPIPLNSVLARIIQHKVDSGMVTVPADKLAADIAALERVEYLAPPSGI